MKGGSQRSTQTERKVPYDNYSTGGGKSGASEDCILSFITNLQKPTAAAAKLTKGDILSISPEPKNQIGVYEKGGVLCGYITSTMYQKKILECISKGKQYEAEVRSISATVIELRVYGGK